MSDLPDWTQSVGSTGIVVANGTLANGGGTAVDVSNYQSVVVILTGHVVATPFWGVLEWLLSLTNQVTLETVYFSAAQDPVTVSFMTIQSPIYASALGLVNSSGQSMDFTVIGSSRVVPAVRVLNEAGPGRSFAIATNMAAGTFYQLLTRDIGPNNYASNGEVMVNLVVNVAGSLQVFYIDSGGIPRLMNLLTVAANTNTNGFFALPQGMVALFWVPSAPNAAGSAVVTVVANTV